MNKWDYDLAFRRNLGLIDKQKQLKNSKIAIAGQGGVGGIHLITLARMGIENFIIADHDVFKTINTNRQYGAMRSTIGLNKAQVMKTFVKDINPDIDVKAIPENVNKSNQDKFLDNVNILIDGIDAFNIIDRRSLYLRAAELGIPVISAGPIGFGTAWLIFDPNGMSFDEYFDIKDGMDEDEMFAAFIAGVAPKFIHKGYLDTKYVNPINKSGPSISSACQLAAGVVGAEVAKILLGRGKTRFAPYYNQFDPYVGRLIQGRLRKGNRSLLQRIKKRRILQMLQGNKK